MTYEEAVADAYCPCHGEPWYVQPGGKHPGKRSCRVRAAERSARFYRTEKGKALMRRRNASPGQRVARRRWRLTEKGRAADKASNDRRVQVANIYLGRAPTADQAAELNQMGRDFAARQKGVA